MTIGQHDVQQLATGRRQVADTPPDYHSGGEGQGNPEVERQEADCDHLKPKGQKDPVAQRARLWRP